MAKYGENSALVTELHDLQKTVFTDLYILSLNSSYLTQSSCCSVLLFQNEDRVLWKLGTLPPGLLTFYKLTHPLDKSWHVLGLGYNPSIDRSEIDSAAVVHYNGNMKPWLELAMTKYRPYWTKYIKYDHPYIRGCNLSEQTVVLKLTDEEEPVGQKCSTTMSLRCVL